MFLATDAKLCPPGSGCWNEKWEVCYMVWFVAGDHSHEAHDSASTYMLCCCCMIHVAPSATAGPSSYNMTLLGHCCIHYNKHLYCMCKHTYILGTLLLYICNLHFIPRRLHNFSKLVLICFLSRWYSEKQDCLQNSLVFCLTPASGL